VRQVAEAAQRAIDPQQPLVGELVFTHESGVHVAALLRDSESYQSIAPSLMGRSYRLVLGKHSGRQAVNGVFDQMGYHLNAAQINQLLPAIRRFAENWKRSPKDYELVAIYDELCGESALRAGVMMEWFYQIPGVDELRSAESFFSFSPSPISPSCLAAAACRCWQPFTANCARKCRCKTGWRITRAHWLLARRLLAESYQQQFQESGT
jgi:hypothetical protein